MLLFNVMLVICLISLLGYVPDMSLLNLKHAVPLFPGLGEGLCYLLF